MSDNNYNKQVVRLGIPDNFIHHGTQEELWVECGIDKNTIVKKVLEVMDSNSISQAG